MVEDNQTLAAYSDGYDFGFSHPHIAVSRAKYYMRSTYIIYSTTWIKGFKNGKSASGVSYGKAYR